MRIAIIGAGNVGASVGLNWLRGGHDVVWGVRDPAKYPDLPSGRLLAPAVAAEGAEAILLATPWPATESAIGELGDLSGKIVLDATNPLGMGAAGLELILGFTTSAGEMVAGWARGASVFKTLNQTGADNMGDPSRYAARPAMFVAGDDEARKPVALALVEDLGFAAFDAGPLANARLLEPLAMLWIDRAIKRGGGPGFALTLQAIDG
jgi:8-hydroxy-5-deazaflavin:NADPH oxidoreductase